MAVLSWGSATVSSKKASIIREFYANCVTWDIMFPAITETHARSWLELESA